MFKYFFGIVLVRVEFKIIKNSFNFASIEFAVQYLELDHFTILRSNSNLKRPQFPLKKFKLETSAILQLEELLIEKEII